MDYVILIRCFLIGILASSSLGPIFVLTFNRGAVYGFFRGVATAVGACIADGFYFFLGLLGILAILKESRHFMFLLDIIGGFLLIVLGLYSLNKARKKIMSVVIGDSRGIFLTISKSFLLTILNPLVFLFFMVIGVQILPAGVEYLSLKQVFAASVMVMLGSLFVLSVVALISSFLGKCMKEKQLKMIYFLTGLVFIGVGIYFLDHLVISVIKTYK